MPLIAFVDADLSSEISKRLGGNSSDEDIFPEHEFIASALRVGLTVSDLKLLTYTDVMKILLAFIGKEQNTATQEDINNFLS